MKRTTLFTATFTAALLMCFVAGSGRGDDKDYLDETLPKTIATSVYDGQRYTVETPDTLDLVDRANWSINVLTRCVEPKYDYELYFHLNVDANPPVLKLGDGGLLNINGKWAEALPMLRVMTGNTTNLDIDSKLIASLVHVTGTDGLCYYPADRPWAFFDPITKKAAQPYADVFGEGRQLLAYSVWYQQTGDPLWKNLAEKKMQTVLDMTLEKEGTYFFRMSRGYTPQDNDRTVGEVVPIGDHEIYDLAKGMTGTPATYIIGFFPQACANWYRLTGFEPAKDLGSGLANYLFKYGKMLDPDTGRNTMDHYVHFSHSMLSNLTHALVFKDREMTKWVKRGFEYQQKMRDPDKTGILSNDPSCACFVADMINIGILLTQAEEGDYWEEIDGWIRNTFVNLQITENDVEQIKARPIKKMEPLPENTIQPADGANRVLGGWYHSINPQARNRAIGCCNGNCSRALYYAWSNILEEDAKRLKVNLLLNRASATADLHSYLPYEGKVVIDMKRARENVLVRIPEWANWNEVSCRIDEETAPFTWDSSFIQFGPVYPNQKIEIGFPLKTRMIKTTYLTQVKGVNPSPENILAGKVLKLNDCEITYKGNTVVDMKPDLGYPLQRQEKYRADSVTMREVERFVSPKTFVW